MNKTIKVIIFDIGKVLIPVDTQYLLGRASDLSGISKERLEVAWRAHHLDITTGKLSVTQFYDDLATACNVRLQLPADQLVKELYVYFEEATITDEMLFLINKLQKCYTVVVLTNTEVETGKIFSQGMIATTVGHVYASSQLHMKKPSPEIYAYVCHNLGVVPQECVFIDDLEENINGARRKGMRGIIYRNHETLVQDLKAIHVI